MATPKSKKFVLWFSELGIKDVPYVGGKNASLGEMYQKLTKQGINVPNGFALTAYAYRYFLKKSGIQDEIKQILSDLDTGDMKNLSERGYRVRQTILNAELPPELEAEITKAYKKLSGSKPVDVAVRSSATAEDLPDASFAGQQETYLNITGDYGVLEATKKCISSLFTNRAISYRTDKDFDHFSIALSVGVQDMVRSDLAASGVMFTIDTESGLEDIVLINAAYGLGENVVKGVVNPDEYHVFKPNMKPGLKPIVTKTVGSKKVKLIYSLEGNSPTKNVPVSKDDRKKFVLTDKEIMTLAKWGVVIENHYKRPMDIEWAKDGKNNKLYIVQARPETIHASSTSKVLEEYKMKKRGKVVCKGQSVGSKIGAGAANIIKDVKDIGGFKKGQVLVTEITDPDWEPIMKIASAIVTNAGGRTSHAAIVSRELGIPCIVGCGDATKKIKQGQKVTVSCAEGNVGFVYNGLQPFEIKKTNLKNFQKPKTSIMINTGNPDTAYYDAQLPSDGVGLCRIEFIIANVIRAHPLALIHYNKISDIDKKKIDELTKSHKSRKEFFVQKMAEGVGKIAAAFYPRDVIVRLSDFKSNEYATLVGGQNFEPTEANPMIGWRGASRYYTPSFKPAFELECQALKKVREEMGLTNVKIMVPFCRTLEEGQKILDVLKEFGLVRGQKSLEVYVMAEIPSNVILAEGFAKLFDGFSIGSNDLTQLTLGLDRDSELVSYLYDERNEAVKTLVRMLINTAKKNKTKVGICGQAPSDFPEFAEFLVEAGIDSMSLNPDTILPTTILVKKKEDKVKKR
ncbi:MAG: phosphoenolpyruvate synthase [bacterium]